MGYKLIMNQQKTTLAKHEVELTEEQYQQYLTNEEEFLLSYEALEWEYKSETESLGEPTFTSSIF